MPCFFMHQICFNYVCRSLSEHLSQIILNSDEWLKDFLRLCYCNKGFATAISHTPWQLCFLRVQIWLSYFCRRSLSD